MDPLGTGLKAKFDFSDVDVMVVEPPLSSRRVLRMAFNGIGMRKLAELDQQVPDRSVVNLAAYDLILIDVKEDAAPVFKLIQEIRSRVASQNPFQVVVASTFEPTQTLINKAFNAGVDDVLVKPVALKTVHDRLVTLIEHRQPFIVTASYIGPDRRRGGGSRPGTMQVPGIPAPNTLRYKTLKPEERPDAAAEIEAAWRQVNRQRAIRCAYQVCFLLQLSLSAPDGGIEYAYLNELERVPVLVGDIVPRLPSSNERAQAMALSDAVLEPLTEAGMRPNELALVLPRTLDRAIELLLLVQGDGDADQLKKETQNVAMAYRRRMEEQAARPSTGF